MYFPSVYSLFMTKFHLKNLKWTRRQLIELKLAALKKIDRSSFFVREVYNYRKSAKNSTYILRILCLRNGSWIQKQQSYELRSKMLTYERCFVFVNTATEASVCFTSQTLMRVYRKYPGYLEKKSSYDMACVKALLHWAFFVCCSWLWIENSNL